MGSATSLRLEIYISEEISFVDVEYNALWEPPNSSSKY